MKKINVTKTFLPPIEEYQAYLEQIWSSGQLTNQGSLLQEFEKQTKRLLNVDNFHFVANGTLALQVSLRALDITEGEVITTPFSYVATTSSILWERCEPVFVDIEPDTFCIDADKIEAAITSRTKAIMPVHVFGHPCDVDKIATIAKKHNLKVIYDAAHAFGVEYNGRSLLSYGDISICSFHATKLFHTIEGGAIITSDKRLSDKVELIKRFGHNDDNHFMLGINTKASEFQAAMGLVNLNYIEHIINQRKAIFQTYERLLSDKFKRPVIKDNTIRNYSYYPVVLRDERQLKQALEKLETKNIFPRRYFYPSLNTLPYLSRVQSCPVSEKIAKSILCLPFYAGLDKKDVERVCAILNTDVT